MRPRCLSLVWLVWALALWAAQGRAGEVSQGQEYKRFRKFVTWSE